MPQYDCAALPVGDPGFDVMLKDELLVLSAELCRAALDVAKKAAHIAAC
jgi:hypothetical protein